MLLFLIIIINSTTLKNLLILSPIFLLSDNTKFEDLNDEIIMYYKRVSSYKKMEGINFVINTLVQNNHPILILLVI